jgi:hypothetical protein
MSAFENGDKPSISQIKPITTSEATELDGPTLAAAELNDRLRGKLVLKPWRTRYVLFLEVLVFCIQHQFQIPHR